MIKSFQNSHKFPLNGHLRFLKVIQFYYFYYVIKYKKSWKHAFW